MGRITPAVRAFFLDAYVRGDMTSQRNVPFEGPTACFTKRRYRDRWNTAIAKRSRAVHKRALTVKTVFITRGTEKHYIRESASATIARTVRSQALVTLNLAGQHLGDPPTHDSERPHCMRAMLVANTDVTHGFANGAIGRVTSWGAETTSKKVRANVPGIQALFYHVNYARNQSTTAKPLSLHRRDPQTVSFK